MVLSCIVLKREVNMGFIFLSAAGSLMQLTIQCLCCDCLRVFNESTGAGTKYRKQLTRQQVKDHPVQNFHRDLSSLRVFIELTGAGAICKALAFFQIQNIRNNSRVNKSRIFLSENTNSFLHIVVFCQHFVKNRRGEKSAAKMT